MRFTLTLILAYSTEAFGFVVQPALRSSTALFGSRRRQKVAARTQWLESRGGGVSPVAEAKIEAGLMKNDQGLDYIKLVHPETGATSDVYLFGGVVTSYCDADGTDYIAVRPDSKMDGSKPISGGLAHCFPQFGPGDIQQHGFARNVVWAVKEMTETSVELELAPNDYTKTMWDKEFLCTFKVVLDADQLSTQMIVDNKGAEAFDFQAALHSYFSVSSLENLEIEGSFSGKEFIDKLEGETKTEDRDTITISQEYDRVYLHVHDPITMKDSGRSKNLVVLNPKGWEDTVIWNPYGKQEMGFDNFVCVESVKFEPVTIEGGKSWEGIMELRPTGSD
jgi:glucose-6-phosphate 1-epimerase